MLYMNGEEEGQNLNDLVGLDRNACDYLSPSGCPVVEDVSYVYNEDIVASRDLFQIFCNSLTHINLALIQ